MMMMAPRDLRLEARRRSLVGGEQVKSSEGLARSIVAIGTNSNPSLAQTLLVTYLALSFPINIANH